MDSEQLLHHLLRSNALLHAEIQHLHRRLDAAGFPRESATATDSDETRASRIVPAVALTSPEATRSA
jgi:hypothetical protein